MYIIESIDKNGFLKNPYYGPFLTKSAATYFLIWPFLFYCGVFNSYANRKIKIFSLVAIILITFCFLGIQSLNGLIICSLAIVSTSIIKFYQGFKNKLNVYGILTAILILITPLAALYSYGLIDNKIHTIYIDAKVGLEIDSNTYWHTNETPQLSNDRKVNQSTFYRVASFKNGLRLILQHPMGAGFTFLPYGYYMKLIFPKSTADHTHSGWVDFALGAGIPGLFLAWTAIFIALFKSIQSIQSPLKLGGWDNDWPFTVVFSLAGIFITWMILEVSEKEYIEHTFFMISFLAASLIKPSVVQISKIS